MTQTRRDRAAYFRDYRARRKITDDHEPVDPAMPLGEHLEKFHPGIAPVLREHILDLAHPEDVRSLELRLKVATEEIERLQREIARLEADLPAAATEYEVDELDFGVRRA